jgi:hypothetical protein
LKKSTNIESLLDLPERYLASGQQLYLCGSRPKLTEHEGFFTHSLGLLFSLLETNKETVEKGDEA